MKKTLIIYGTTTGNSETLSLYCESILKSSLSVQTMSSHKIKEPYSFSNNYDLYILCCSTWGINPAELQEDFEIFWLKLNKKSIQDKQFVILGLGDDYYPFFAKAVDIIFDDIVKYGGKVLLKPQKINDPWEEKKSNIDDYLNKVIAKL